MTQHPITPPKGMPMPQTLQYWQKRADNDLTVILQQKDEISTLKQRNNQLAQKRDSKKVLVDKSLLIDVFNEYSETEIKLMPLPVMHIWLEGKKLGGSDE